MTRSNNRRRSGSASDGAHAERTLDLLGSSPLGEFLEKGPARCLLYYSLWELASVPESTKAAPRSPS